MFFFLLVISFSLCSPTSPRSLSRSSPNLVGRLRAAPNMSSRGSFFKGQGHRGQRSNFCISAVLGLICMKRGECTLKKSYKRPPHIFPSSSESKIRSIKIHDHINKPMSNSGSVSFCIPKCVILLTQTKHV